ncbi:MAG TPA: RNA polymerase sigma factor [Pirellulales bacterium]|nr:RNA polymerase sigma factor [Pirellulales bacterium]
MPVPGPELLTRLLDQHGATLVLYARQWCHTPEDVVQEACLQLMRETSEPANVAGWMFRVVRNGAISAGRGESRRVRHESAAARQARPWFEPNAGESLDARAVARDLETLPDDERETIVLRLWGGLSFEQIAELTGTSTSTAHRRYVAGLTALRERHLPCTKEDQKT